MTYHKIFTGAPFGWSAQEFPAGEIEKNNVKCYSASWIRESVFIYNNYMV